MEITAFIVSHREQARLLGDYNAYRAQLSRRLLTLRKKLGRTASKGKKYSPAGKITAEDIESNHEFAYLLVLTAERAWAQAMHIKSSRSTGSAAGNGITGSTRSHIISRLHKAAVHAKGLLTTLDERSGSHAGDRDLLEARAYSSSLEGSELFEKARWEDCLTAYSAARLIYAALLTSTKDDIFKEIMTSTIDPSIRYAAYQSHMPRSLAIPTVARRFFPRSDQDLTAAIDKLDPEALRDAKKGGETKADTAPQTITWRSRTVNIEDAAIAAALATANAISERLSKLLSSSTGQEMSAEDKAAAYDDLLIASQDAVDATKHAIDELAGEGVEQTDKRMQSLQITRTAVTYQLVSWRIGRNRVLTGEMDGLTADQGSPDRAVSTSRTLARLNERVVLYGSTLQSIDSIRDLPGVAGDEPLLEDLADKTIYFQALQTLTIAQSHALLSSLTPALALFAHALSTLAHIAHAAFTASSPFTPVLLSLPNLALDPAHLRHLRHTLQAETARHHALVEIAVLTAKEEKSTTRPLVETLHSYPRGGADLTNLVNYPPKLEVVAVKPLFLDVAWNYIAYPGRGRDGAGKAQDRLPATGRDKGEAQGKKGWFGFGR